MRSLGVGAVAAAATALVGTLAAVPAVAESGPSHHFTTVVEANRVDRVPTPELVWGSCGDEHAGECATVELPLDYDEPDGKKISVALRKVSARDQSKRIGSLFVNPGGPGGSAKDMVRRLANSLSGEVRDRFDVIGMDPRGTNDSERIRCFPDLETQGKVLELVSMGFPVTPQEEEKFKSGAKGLAKWCSGYGREMASASSTAQVARDMDVLRRAVGDEKLTYLGFSYGTYLGQVYANMFPDRVRAVAIDGVINPFDWVGTERSAWIPLSARLDSGGGAWRALKTLLEACGKSGRCPLKDPVADFERVAQRLKEKPLILNEDGIEFTITYQVFIRGVLGQLYSSAQVALIPDLIAYVDELMKPGVPADLRLKAAAGYQKLISAPLDDEQGKFNERYPNALEVPSVVQCSDSRNPKDINAWSKIALTEDFRAPYFGRNWLWASAACSSEWTAFDEDAYQGPFNRKTSAPIMVVGNEYDPATNMTKAREVSQLLPYSRLVISNNWGHTAYLSSICARNTVDSYLLDPQRVGRGEPVSCNDGAQPYK